MKFFNIKFYYKVDRYNIFVVKYTRRIDMIEIEICEQARKELEKLAKKDKKLFAEIRKKLEQLSKENYDALTIKPIKKKKDIIYRR